MFVIVARFAQIPTIAPSLRTANFVITGQFATFVTLGIIVILARFAHIVLIDPILKVDTFVTFGTDTLIVTMRRDRYFRCQPEFRSKRQLLSHRYNPYNVKTVVVVVVVVIP
jgi:hypothetical protein